MTHRPVAAARVLLVLLALPLVSTCGGQPTPSPRPSETAPPPSPTRPPLPASPSPAPSPSQPPPSRTPIPPAPTRTPSPRPTHAPISWVGPLLYAAYYHGGAVIPILDLGNGELQWLPTAAPVDDVLAWSPDGCSAIYGSRDPDTGPQIRIVEIGTLRDRQLLPYSWLDRDFRWSPTGEWIAFELTDSTYRKLGGIYLVRPDNGEIVRLTQSLHTPHHLHGWTPDGKAVVYQAGSELRMIAVDSLEERAAQHQRWASETQRELIFTDPHTFREVSFEMPGEFAEANYVLLYWTPDLRYFAIFAAEWCEEGFGPTTLYWVDTSSGKGHRIETEGFNLWVNAPLSPDGTTLAFAAAGLDEHSDDRAAIYFLDMTAGRISGFVSVPEFSILGPHWSPDGSMLTFVEYRRHPEFRRTLAIYHYDTKEIVYLSDTLAEEWEEWSVEWSPRMVYGPGSCLGENGGE